MPRISMMADAPQQPCKASTSAEQVRCTPNLSEIKTASTAENELLSLGQRPQLKNTISSLNLTVLKERYKCSDIFPMVKLELLRNQDKTSKRIDLAMKVAGSMADSLLKSFLGDPLGSKLVLRVNITVVSDGCTSSRADRLRDLLGRGRSQGKGLSKLTVSYCLYCRETERVAVAKQLTRSEEHSCREGKCSKAVLMELEEYIRNEISKEVKFTCCSRLPQWYQVARSMLAVDQLLPKKETEEESGETEHTDSFWSS